MSDRIVVMHEGTMTAIRSQAISSELILKYATSEVPTSPLLMRNKKEG